MQNSSIHEIRRHLIPRAIGVVKDQTGAVVTNSLAVYIDDQKELAIKSTAMSTLHICLSGQTVPHSFAIQSSRQAPLPLVDDRNLTLQTQVRASLVFEARVFASSGVRPI